MSLFNFARWRGCLFKDRKTEALAVKTLKDMGKEISTFSPTAISALLVGGGKGRAPAQRLATARKSSASITLN